MGNYLFIVQIKRLRAPTTQSLISLMPKEISVWMKEVENIQHKNSSLTCTDFVTSVLVDIFFMVWKGNGILKRSPLKRHRKEIYMWCS